MFSWVQSEAGSSLKAPPTNQTNGKGVFSLSDSVDQPKIKGQGRLKRTRLSIRRHLQKHGLAHGDSDSDLDDQEGGLGGGAWVGLGRGLGRYLSVCGGSVQDGRLPANTL